MKKKTIKTGLILSSWAFSQNPYLLEEMCFWRAKEKRKTTKKKGKGGKR